MIYYYYLFSINKKLTQKKYTSFEKDFNKYIIIFKVIISAISINK